MGVSTMAARLTAEHPDLDERSKYTARNSFQQQQQQQFQNYGSQAWDPANQKQSREQALKILMDDPPATQQSLSNDALIASDTPAASATSVLSDLDDPANQWKVQALSDMTDPERYALLAAPSGPACFDNPTARPACRSPIERTYDNLEKKHPKQYGHGCQLVRSSLLETLETGEEVKSKWDMHDTKQVMDGFADEHASAAYLKRQPRNGDQTWSTSSVSSRWSRHSGVSKPSAAGGAAADNELHNQVTYYIDESGRRIAVNARRAVECKSLHLGIPIPLDMWSVGRGEYKDLGFPSRNLPDRCDGPRSRGTSKHPETPDVGLGKYEDQWKKEGTRHTPEVIYKFDQGQRVMPSRHTKRAAPIRCVNLGHRAPGANAIRDTMAVANKYSLR